MKTDLNKQDQYDGCNNPEVLRIPDIVSHDQLQENIIEIFKQIDVRANTIDTENWHRMGNLNKTTIICFTNRKNYNIVLEKVKLEQKTGYCKIGFEFDVRAFSSEVYGGAGRTHIICSAKGVVKLRRTTSEHPVAITHETDY